jgi:hypothetical protein
MYLFTKRYFTIFTLVVLTLLSCSHNDEVDLLFPISNCDEIDLLPIDNPIGNGETPPHPNQIYSKKEFFKFDINADSTLIDNKKIKDIHIRNFEKFNIQPQKTLRYKNY